ncbi:hypothetical protein [Propioniciclava flava]
MEQSRGSDRGYRSLREVVLGVLQSGGCRSEGVERGFGVQYDAVEGSDFVP